MPKPCYGSKPAGSRSINMQLEPFQQLSLQGGFLLLRVVLSHEPMTDAIGRTALASTVIIGSTLEITLCATSPTPSEISISLYHEVLEAAAVAAPEPPLTVCEMNEADFETAAQQAYVRLGPATPTTLNKLLVDFGF
jgi:hypothetical protein